MGEQKRARRTWNEASASSQLEQRAHKREGHMEGEAGWGRALAGLAGRQCDLDLKRSEEPWQDYKVESCMLVYAT